MLFAEAEAGLDIVPAEHCFHAEFVALGSPFPRTGTFLLCAQGAVGALIRPVEADGSLRIELRDPAQAPAMLAEIECFAKSRGIGFLRTQWKVEPEGDMARAYRSLGYDSAYFSRKFEITVPGALKALAPLTRAGQRLCHLSFSDLHGYEEKIGETLQSLLMMDAFEVEARLDLQGPGRLDMSEGAAVTNGTRLCGFLVVGHSDHPRKRTIEARWVDPNLRHGGLVNLILLTHALRRAEGAGVHRVRFSANPQRHADTFGLARRLCADDLGEFCSFVRRLDSVG